jgi:phosphatidylserine/phosphatidylglycerophosphate/cardiolipin synthase-like enzyme
MKKAHALTFFFSLWISTLFSAEITLTEKLYYKNYIQFYFDSVYTRYLSSQSQSTLNLYLSHPSIFNYTNAFKFGLGSYIRSPHVLNAITYLNFKWEEPTSKDYVKKLIEMYYLEKRIALDEIAEDPRYQIPIPVPGMGMVLVSARVKAWIKILGEIKTYRQTIAKATTCVTNLKSTPEIRGGLIQKCLRDNFPQVNGINTYIRVSFAALDLGSEIPNYPGAVISRTGFIPGNKVTTLNQNQRTWDGAYLSILENEYQPVVKKYMQRWKGKSDQQMVEEMLNIIKTSTHPIEDIFSEGLSVDAFDINKNVIWQSYQQSSDGELTNPEHQIFPNILKAMRKAESTIFIDLFFWGGTMAISLTKEILSLLDKKPQLKFIFLHDNINNFGHQDEMAPLFNFLRASMVARPSRIIVLPSYILKNVTGFPDFFDQILDDDTWKKMGLDRKMSLYIKAKSDHSKVIVIDGDRPLGNPVAFVGSKNMTDSSGALCNDEVMMIEGPAATVILDNYWKDLYDALKLDWRTNDFWDPQYQQVYNKGVDKALGQSMQRPKQIKLILAPIDVLKRYEAETDEELYAIHQVTATAKGNDLVRIGENSVGSFITSAIYQNVFAILNAQKQILINDQLLYDPRIIRSLVHQKNKGVAVKIILEEFEHSEFPGMPNLLYLQDMLSAGLDVRWKLHQKSSLFVPEHHSKTLSIDGFDPQGKKVIEGPGALLMGSANKDYMTMRGAFRETQVEVFNLQAQETHDSLFWKNWNDQSQGTKIANFDDFINSPAGKSMKDNNITVDEFISYVRGFMEMLYTVKTIER